jgi:hypothetical protein
MQQCNVTAKSFNNRDIDVASLTDVASLHLSAGRSGECETATGLETESHQCQGHLQLSDESTLAAAAAVSVQLTEAAKES